MTAQPAVPAGFDPTDPDVTFIASSFTRDGPPFVEGVDFIDMVHPTAGHVKNIDSPFRFDGEKVNDHVPPPMLGQHTSEVLRQYIGLTERQLADLNARGVIKSLTTTSYYEEAHG